MAARIQTRLHDHFPSDDLEVRDESHRHRGHAGAPSGGNSHFRIRLVSAQFDAMPRLKRHRLVYGVLADEIDHIHAIALDLLSPQEARLRLRSTENLAEDKDKNGDKNGET